MMTKHNKSAARLVNRDCINRRGLDLSKEVLWVSVCQRAAELPAVKVGGKTMRFCRSAQMAEFFFKRLTFDE